MYIRCAGIPRCRYGGQIPIQKIDGLKSLPPTQEQIFSNGETPHSRVVLVHILSLSQLDGRGTKLGFGGCGRVIPFGVGFVYMGRML